MAKSAALLASNLRLLMAARAIRQSTLASEMGVSENAISKMVHQKGNLSFSMIDKLAEVLQVPIADLFSDRDPFRHGRALQTGSSPSVMKGSPHAPSSASVSPEVFAFLQQFANFVIAQGTEGVARPPAPTESPASRRRADGGSVHPSRSRRVRPTKKP